MIAKIKSIGAVNIFLVLILITFIIPPLILNSIFIGVLFVFVLTRFIINKRVFVKDNFNKVSLLFILYFLTLLFSLFYSDNLGTGAMFITQSFSFLVIPIIPLFIAKKEVNLLLISKTFIHFLCCVFFLLLFIAIFKNLNEGYTLEYIYHSIMGLESPKDKYSYFNYWYFVYDEFTSPLDIQPIYLGLFANIGLVFLFFLKKIKAVKFYYFKLIILGLLILFTASRWQILIGVINYSVFILFFNRFSIFKKFIGIISVFFLVLIISIANPVTRTRLVEALSFNKAYYKDDFGGTSIRIKKWNSAISSIVESPLLGYGVGDAKNILLERYKKDKFYLGYYNKYNAHNQYLDTLLCVGFVGFIALGFLLYYSYMLSPNKLYLFLITNVYVLGFLTESILNRQWGVISFPFFLIIYSIFDYERMEA